MAGPRCSIGPLGPAPRRSAAAPGRGRFPFGREERNGVRILRAWGTALRPGRFAGRAANYLSYFGSAWLAGLAVPPAGRGRRADRSADHRPRRARAARRRCGARFVFLCQDVFPGGGAPRSRTSGASGSTALLERVTLAAHRPRGPRRRGGRDDARAARRRQGRRPRARHGHPQLGGLPAIVPGPKENAFARAHGLAEPFVVMHSGNLGLSQGLDVLVDAAARLCRDIPTSSSSSWATA